MNLREYMAAKGLVGKDIVAVARDTGFVKCDKQVVSKVVNIAYGVTFVEQVWDAIYRKHGEPDGAQKPVRAPKKENRTRGVKLCVRFTESEYSAVLHAKEQSGIDTMQDFLSRVILQGVRE